MIAFELLVDMVEYLADEHSATTDRPIAHGTYGGYKAEGRRGLSHCADCRAAIERRRVARGARR